jgi:hypothetical protein
MVGDENGLGPSASSVSDELPGIPMDGWTVAHLLMSALDLILMLGSLL